MQIIIIFIKLSSFIITNKQTFQDLLLFKPSESENINSLHMLIQEKHLTLNTVQDLI